MKIKIAILVLLVVSLFANVALAFNISDNADIKSTKDREISKLKKKLDKVEDSERSLSEFVDVQQAVPENQAKTLTEKFFKAQFEYHNGTYKERFEKVKEMVNESVYEQLTSAGVPDTPNGVKFENHINDLQVYLTNDGLETTGLIMLKTNYVVDKNEFPPVTQIYWVKIGEENKQLKITQLMLIGTFSPMSGS